VRLVFAELREEGTVDDTVEAAALAAVKGGGALAAAVAPSVYERIVRMAGVLNSHEVTARVTGDPRYAAGKNGRPPRKVGSQLVLLDCLSCDKCVPVCPNDANFSVETPLEEVAYEDVVRAPDGRIARAPGGVWRVKKPQQWANYADACNECGNCDVFCPEDGGPYVVKARFFGSRASLEAAPALDGILVEADGAAGLRVEARIGGRRYALEVPPRGPAIVDDGRLRAAYDPTSGALLDVQSHGDADGEHRLSGAVFLTLRALVRGAVDGGRMNPVSAAVRVGWPA
jgi:ferredoxin